MSQLEPTQPLGEIRVGESAPVAGSLIVSRPNSPQAETEIRIYEGIPAVEFLVTVDTGAVHPIDGKESA